MAEIGGKRANLPSTPGTSALRVLIADADEPTLGMLQSMLEAQGCEVVAARSGPELLALAIDASPDVIMFEGRLPVMDGWAVCDVLSHVLDDTPLVFLSTQSLDADFRRAKANGASCCIKKPFAMGDLMQIVGPLAADLERVAASGARASRNSRETLELMGPEAVGGQH